MTSQATQVVEPDPRMVSEADMAPALPPVAQEGEGPAADEAKDSPEAVLVEQDDSRILEEAAKDTTPLTPQEEAALEAETELDFDLDLKETKEFKKYFRFYTHKHRKTFARWLKRAEPFLPFVREVFKEKGLPQDLVLLPFAESGYNPWAYSRAGAAGMWQFMPFTGRKYGLRVDWWIDERRDPYLATYAAADYLLMLHGMFDDWYLALAAYNAGEGKISRALKKTGTDDFFELSKNNHKLSYRARLRAETKNYVPKFLAISKIFQNLDSLGFEPVSWDQAPDLAEVKVPGGTDLLAMSNAGGIKWRAFHKLNPAFRRQVSPPDKTCVVYVPADKVNKIAAYLANPKTKRYAGYQRYKIRSGDSWWRISRKFGVPIAVLKKVNRNYSNNLRIGKDIMIPGVGESASIPTASSSAKARRYAQSRANYIVRKGDTLWDIANGYNVSVNTLKKANGLRSSRLKVGQKLYIPDASPKATAKSRAQARKVKEEVVKSSGTTYIVRKGDSWWRISRRFDITVSELKRVNSTRSNSLKPGQKVVIPAKAGAKSLAATAESKLVRYKVRKGDTLWSISRKFGVSPTSLKKWNSKLGRTNLIHPGDRLDVYVQ